MKYGIVIKLLMVACVSIVQLTGCSSDTEELEKSVGSAFTSDGTYRNDLGISTDTDLQPSAFDGCHVWREAGTYNVGSTRRNQGRD